jgi:ATP-dependent RNA helicase RhlE
VDENRQVQALRRGVDILVATPGRLRALISRRAVSFTALEILVLDEADRMLDMGFIQDVKRIVAMLPRRRQTLFFSATMPSDIQALASSMLVNPVRVDVAPPSRTVDSIEQRVYHVAGDDKRALLLHVLEDQAVSKALVFTRTKSGANRLAKHLAAAGVAADAIHGNKSQAARERALAAFKRGAVRILVATDIAARGIDIDAVTHVINYEIPNVPESYVHRIGRTGRAGAAGVALSFCDSNERSYVRNIERAIRSKVTVHEEHPFRSRTDHVRPALVAERDRRSSHPVFSGSGRRRHPLHRGVNYN